MKNLRFPMRIFLGILVLVPKIYAQQIEITTDETPQQLVEHYLIEDCMHLSNISSTTNGNASGFSTIGAFHAGNSNFPFQSGIVLSTGNIEEIGAPVTSNILNEGNTSWVGDSDLEAATGYTNTFNASVLEFDFVSSINHFEFNFLLASEEYGIEYLCDYADAFAFLIKEAGTSAPYTNLAVLPDGSPVSTTNIREEIIGFCGEQNIEYFDAYNIGDTNFDGRTVVLTASTAVTPYTQYHVKLVIAEEFDPNYDSAVFIESSSFSPSLDLGTDISTCSPSVNLNADIGNNLATYQWFLNNSILTNETNAILTADNSGAYHVEITIPIDDHDCILQDTIHIEVNAEQEIAPIPDYELCDEEDGDGFTTFNLQSKNADAIAAIQPGSYLVTYYYSITDAENQQNAITTPITNTQNPQTVYVRLDEINTYCVAIAPINLIVYSIPNITEPSPLIICDTDYNGLTNFSLTVKDNEITNNQNDLEVNYHLNLQDAENGENALGELISNSQTPSQVFYASVTNEAGCINTTPIEVLVNIPPEISYEPVFLDACDPEHDGYATFNLNDALEDIIADTSNVIITYYLSEPDANNAVNPIPNPEAYGNINYQQQTVYIRLEDNSTGCFVVRSFEIHANLLISEPIVIDRTICDANGDGIGHFSLSDFEADILGLLLNDVDVIFYYNQDDLNNNTNPVDETSSIEITSAFSPMQFYISLNSDTCQEFNAFKVFLSDVSTNNEEVDVTVCDIDEDGIKSIPFNTLTHLAFPNQNVTVSYYYTLEDAQFGSNPIPGSFITTGSTVLYASLSSSANICNTTTQINLTILPAPAVTEPEDYTTCDDDSDGFMNYNLEDKISEIVSNTNGLTIQFYTSLVNATTNNNPIPNLQNYNTNSDTIYICVENEETGCRRIVHFTLNITPKPEVISTISDFVYCDTNQNDTAYFILAEKDDEIINNQSNVIISYYLTQDDALNLTNEIDKNVAFQNTSNPQTIHFNITSTINEECSSVGTFFLRVAEAPIYNAVEDVQICDSDGVNDGFFEFDLSPVITAVTENSPHNLNLSFHTSQLDAENNTNAIPLNFTNTELNQQIFIRIENEFNCYQVETFGVTALLTPEISTAEPLALCSINNNTTANFDLTQSNFEIYDIRQDNLEIAYYESLDDLHLQINEISDPTNYQNISNPQTLYLSVYNTSTNCYAFTPIVLEVYDLPEITEEHSIYSCDNEENQYHLTLANSILSENSSAYTFSYHPSQIDAENNTNALQEFYTYQTNNDIIYVRIENPVTSCYTTTYFNLFIQSVSIVNTPNPYVTCDTDYDGLIAYNLTENDATILGSLDASNYIITYYSSLEAAENGDNAYNDTEMLGTQTIYFRLENSTTTCYDIGSFDIFINRKPFVSIPDQTICLSGGSVIVSADTGYPNDSYLWSTNETSPEIEISTIGTYSVVITSEHGCATTTSFSVIASEAAHIDLIEVEDFANPNTITVHVSGNGSYLYQLNDSEFQESNFFTNVLGGLHTITVTDSNNCNSISQTVAILDAPQFFTPNNDGYHDYWHITSIDAFQDSKVFIFDRYGKLLKVLLSDSVGWDGTYLGNNLPSTDYWFVAKIKSDEMSMEKKGHFSLRR